MGCHLGEVGFSHFDSVVAGSTVMNRQPVRIFEIETSCAISTRLARELRHRRSWAFIWIATIVGLSNLVAVAQKTPSPIPARGAISGVVRDSAGKPVGEASVRLEQQGGPVAGSTTTNSEGGFAFSSVTPGTYNVIAEKSGLRSRTASVVDPSEGNPSTVTLTLEPSGQEPSKANSSTLAGPMEFADTPSFTVAAVTDWTAAGGHGSDSSLRTSEALTRDTLTLKPRTTGTGDPGTNLIDSSASEQALRTALSKSPDSFEANHALGKYYLQSRRYRESVPFLEAAYRIEPANFANGYDLALALKDNGDFAKARDRVNRLIAHKETADLHRLSGELYEKTGDSLAAVREFERAVRANPSEQNYFEWGSELLLHRAVLQAKDVFAAGAKAYPQSARMLTALGAALFAAAFYDEAALRLCEASDLNPNDPEPYLFMGRIEVAAPNPLGCVEQKLARFVELQPANPLANFFYAMAVWKQKGQSIDPATLQRVETMLTKAVTIDPRCSEAYLQLGVLNASQHNYSKAIGFYTKAIETSPQLSEAHYRLGVAYDRVGDRSKARQEFQLHDEIEKQQAAEVERQRRQVKQFLVVEPVKPIDVQAH
jgi:tetratricopeptide (TPR) repeat protein